MNATFFTFTSSATSSANGSSTVAWGEATVSAGSGRRTRSPCALRSDSAAEHTSRTESMAETSDGFRIAETDLSLRGPGDFFGTRQSGLPAFRVADQLRDAAVLEEARQEAFKLVATDPDLRAPEHRALRAALLARWRGKLDLASVG